VENYVKRRESLYGGSAGAAMIDVVFADQHELFHIGMAEILVEADDFSLIAQARSAEQLVSILGTFVPHVLVLSTKFLPAFSQIESLLQRRRTALLLLADENDHVAYVRWLQARGIVYRSMDRSALIHAIRQVARGELFVQERSDIRNEPSLR
jgi:DNA-binding NarL/FixJ family response regulator